MRKSIIFTDKELEMMEARRQGSRKDTTGHFASRIKPKIMEILSWFNSRKMLKMLIKRRRIKKNERRND